MDDLSPTKLLTILEQVNQRLVALLGSSRTNLEQLSNVTPDVLEALLNDLAQAAPCLRCLPPDEERPPELRQVLETYRQNLENLENVLPHLHRHLLIERAQLETARERHQAVESWVRTSKMTI
jgi:hypothetical protein